MSIDRTSGGSVEESDDADREQGGESSDRSPQKDRKEPGNTPAVADTHRGQDSEHKPSDANTYASPLEQKPSQGGFANLAEEFDARAKSREAAGQYNDVAEDRTIESGSLRDPASPRLNEESIKKRSPEELLGFSLEGARDHVVDDPKDSGRTITDIDHVQDGVLWEEKSAINATNVDRWTAKHIDKKFDAYLEARQNLPGCEEAPIGFRFVEPNPDPEFKLAVEQSINKLKESYPDVKICLEWS